MMKRLALAASVCLAMSSGTLLAQQQPDRLQTPVQPQEQDVSGAQEDGIAAVANSAEIANGLKDLKDVSADSIRIVQLYDSEELSDAISAHEAEIDGLRNALEGNKELWSAVRDAYMKSLGTTDDDAQLLPSQIVAIERSAGDNLTVYVGGETSG